MENVVIKKMLQDGYNAIAFTDKYIMGWTLRHVVYFTICDRELVDRVTCLDKASRGAGSGSLEQVCFHLWDSGAWTELEMGKERRPSTYRKVGAGL